MRELEQEQFRQFCQLNGIGTVNTTEEEEVLATNEDLNTQSTT
jgi:DNA repair protein RadC